MGNINKIGGWMGALGFLASLTVVATLSGCMGELKPGTLHPSEQAAVAAAPAPTSAGTGMAALQSTSGIRFSMDKWLDAQGTTTAAVSGAFARFSVDLDQAMALDHLVGASATITVDLTSLDTGSEPRDVNIEESYFETNIFTTATVDFLVTESVAAGAADGDDAGEHMHVRADASLTLHGTTASLGSVELLASRVAEGIRVRTKQPIAVRSTSFNMPVAALLARCGHFGIAEAALVEADVVIAR